jgi:hypothetical protein
LLGERLAGGEVRQWSEGGEGVADAEEEVAVAKAPEVLGVVVQVPCGAGEDAGTRDFEENGVNNAVLVVFGFVRQAGDEAVDDEGEEEMFVVNVVQREHGAAVEQELRGEGLKAELVEREAKRWLGSAGKDWEGQEKNKAGQSGAEVTVQCRNGVGNRHGTERVL